MDCPCHVCLAFNIYAILNFMAAVGKTNQLHSWTVLPTVLTMDIEITLDWGVQIV